MHYFSTKILAGEYFLRKSLECMDGVRISREILEKYLLFGLGQLARPARPARPASQASQAREVSQARLGGQTSQVSQEVTHQCVLTEQGRS